ncbi:hypothetical protein BHE74_00005807 [Ensete ventricosum]|nr:hypothetical protein BHE74_00005807 [Ensete ventricosum]RZR85718.1 hypothetical protein BHM03_00012744 [Ensete ventricosum]
MGDSISDLWFDIDIEEAAAKRSVEEQKQKTAIGALQTDLDLVYVTRERALTTVSVGSEDGNKAFERGGSGDAQIASPDQLRDISQAKEDLLAGDGVLYPLSGHSLYTSRDQLHKNIRLQPAF